MSMPRLSVPNQWLALGGRRISIAFAVTGSYRTSHGDRIISSTTNPTIAVPTALSCHPVRSAPADRGGGHAVQPAARVRAAGRRLFRVPWSLSVLDARIHEHVDDVDSEIHKQRKAAGHQEESL